MTAVTNWVGHVHYTDGNIEEIIVAAPPGEQHTALRLVLKARGLKSAAEPGVAGIYLQEDAPNATQHSYGQAAKPASNQQRARPSTFRVTVIIGSMSQPIRNYAIHSHAAKALSTVLEGLNLGSITPHGYLVEQYKDGASGKVYTPVIAYGPDFANVQLSKEHITLENAPAQAATTRTPLVIPANTSARPSTWGEKVAEIKEYRIIKPLTSKELAP